MSYSELLHDKRIVRRNLDKNLLTPEQQQARLDGLPDLEGRYEYLATEQEVLEAIHSAAQSSASHGHAAFGGAGLGGDARGESDSGSEQGQ